MFIGYAHMQKYAHAYTDLDGWLSDFCFLNSALQQQFQWGPLHNYYVDSSRI